MNTLPIKDLRESGLLWLINRVVFHPRGFALGMVHRADGEFIGWTLQGDGCEPWRFDDSEDDLFVLAEDTLEAARNVNKTFNLGDTDG